MKKIIEKHDRIKQLIGEINIITQDITSNEISFFGVLTVPVGYSSEDGCFKDIVNWLYVLFIEICGPNVQFFEEKFSLYKLNLLPGAANITIDVHHLRTVSSHNLDFSNPNDVKKKKYYENWFFLLIGKYQAESNEEYGVCLLYLLENVIQYLETLRLCIIEVNKDEHFGDIILVEWKRRNDRSYSVYDFEVVFAKRLEQFGIGVFLDTNKISRREIDKWRNELKLLKDGFDFEVEAGRVIDKYIAERKYCPVDPKDLLDLGVTKLELISFYNKVLEEFYREPRDKQQLLQWVQDTRTIGNV